MGLERYIIEPLTLFKHCNQCLCLKAELAVKSHKKHIGMHGCWENIILDTWTEMCWLNVITRFDGQAWQSKYGVLKVRNPVVENQKDREMEDVSTSSEQAGQSTYQSLVTNSGQSSGGAVHSPLEITMVTVLCTKVWTRTHQLKLRFTKMGRHHLQHQIIKMYRPWRVAYHMLQCTALGLKQNLRMSP